MPSHSTSSSAIELALHISPEIPTFEIVKEIPQGMPKLIEEAVMDFMRESHMPRGVDLGGFYYQTLQTMAGASILGRGGDLWLATSEGELWAYVMAHMSNDIDGRLTYCVSQAWVRKDQRGKPWVKRAWKKIRQRAKDSFCKHFMVISSRGNDLAYCRFLGRGFHPYASILKEEL